MANLTRRQFIKAGVGVCIGIGSCQMVQAQPTPVAPQPFPNIIDGKTDLVSFPMTTKDSTGILLTRDETRLLLTFKTPQKLSEIGSDLSGTGMMIEPGAARVNHTPTRIWIRSASGTPISQNIVNQLEVRFALKLDWIGPIYSRPLDQKVPRPEAALRCPLPRVLIIKPQPNVTDDVLRAALKVHRLEEVPDRSRDLIRTKYYVLTPGAGIKTVYGLVDTILQTNKQLVREVRFSNMPLLNPSASCLTGIPTDTYYFNRSQWNMDRIQAGSRLGLAGWNVCTGDQSVVIAMVDRDGFDTSHPDLAPNYANSFAKTWDGTQTYPHAQHSDAHGTQCAGIAAASHNGSGIAGVMSICKIMPLRPANSTEDEVESAIMHAANHGANIISMSFGWYLPPTDPSLSEVNAALDHASGKNLVICAATRNDGLSTIAYPANYSVVIACGASNDRDARCASGDFPYGNNGSNYGPELSVVAPGGLLPLDGSNNRPGIPTTFPGGQYDPAFWGTSAATPQIAGLAGLLMSRWPQLKNNPCVVREIIERTADKVPSWGSYNQMKSHGPWWDQMGYGRINVHRALTEGQKYVDNPSCRSSDIAPPLPPVGLQVQ